MDQMRNPKEAKQLLAQVAAREDVTNALRQLSELAKNTAVQAAIDAYAGVQATPTEAAASDEEAAA